jgi:hypothetical protein
LGSFGARVGRWTPLVDLLIAVVVDSVVADFLFGDAVVTVVAYAIKIDVGLGDVGLTWAVVAVLGDPVSVIIPVVAEAWTLITHISEAIVIRVDLVGVVIVWAVVAGVGEGISIGVEEVIRAWAEVTGIADPVLIGVDLATVGVIWTVVTGVWLGVGVGIERVIESRAPVASVGCAVAVHIGCVILPGTEVTGVGGSVPVMVLAVIVIAIHQSVRVIVEPISAVFDAHTGRVQRAGRVIAVPEVVGIVVDGVVTDLGARSTCGRIHAYRVVSEEAVGIAGSHDGCTDRVAPRFDDQKIGVAFDTGELKLSARRAAIICTDQTTQAVGVAGIGHHEDVEIAVKTAPVKGEGSRYWTDELVYVVGAVLGGDAIGNSTRERARHFISIRREDLVRYVRGTVECVVGRAVSRHTPGQCGPEQNHRDLLRR